MSLVHIFIMPWLNFVNLFFNLVLSEISESEKIAENSLSTFESLVNKKLINQKDEDPQKYYTDNRITRKMSSILEFLAEIYELRNE